MVLKYSGIFFRRYLNSKISRVKTIGKLNSRGKTFLWLGIVLLHPWNPSVKQTNTHNPLTCCEDKVDNINKLMAYTLNFLIPR